METPFGMNRHGGEPIVLDRAGRAAVKQ